MTSVLNNLKVLAVKILSRAMYWFYDPYVEAQLGDRCDYEYFQSERRRKTEMYLAKYFGPKL